jgi:hypothetical protein
MTNTLDKLWTHWQFIRMSNSQLFAVKEVYYVMWRVLISHVVTQAISYKYIQEYCYLYD